ncbi:hypothetical protein HY933_00810 [Candidatus Falkowbacteria bacterium]|nr:hypothetical protein [Candidatus Falkowbacteria bacterium]
MDYLKITKIAGGILLVCLLVFIQLSFLANLPFPLSAINLVFIVLCFVTLLLDYQLGWWAGCISGLLLELYSVAPFGAIIIPLMVVLVLINFLFKLLFTNRSLSSLLALSTLGLVVYTLLHFFYLKLFFVFGWSTWNVRFDMPYVTGILWQIGLVIVGLTVIFLPLRFFSRRFKSVFIVEGRR